MDKRITYLTSSRLTFDFQLSKMAKILVITAVTFLLVHLTCGQYTCDKNPYTDGCSIEIDGQDFWYFYKWKFTPACQKHDVCYACVSTDISIQFKEFKWKIS